MNLKPVYVVPKPCPSEHTTLPFAKRAALNLDIHESDPKTSGGSQLTNSMSADSQLHRTSIFLAKGHPF